MARAPSHLIIRNGVYYYRRRVPEWLRHKPEFGGREVFQTSLGARTVDEARRRIQQLRLDDLFANHQANDNVKEEASTVLSEPLLRQIATDNYRRGLEWLRKTRGQDGEDDADELAAQNVGALNDPSFARRARDVLRHSMYAAHRTQAEGLAQQMDIEQTDANLGRIEGALFESELKLEGARVELANGYAFPSWQPGNGGDATERAPTVREAHWTFRRMADAALRQSQAGESWAHKVRTVVGLFEAHIGPNVPIHQIDRRKVRDFVNDLRFTPRAMSQRFPGMTLAQAIEANDARDRPFPAISPNTIRDNYFSIVRWVFQHALELEAVTANPTTGIRIKEAAKSGMKAKKPPFTVDELNALFRLPFFAGCWSVQRCNTPGSFRFDDHRLWAPLLMLYTGARTSEIAQLAVSDVRDDHRFPHLTILTEFDPDDPDDHAFVVSHKTANARRNVPLHPALIRLGFLKYVQARRAAGDVRLFPDWALPSDKRKLYSSAPWIRNLNQKCIPSISTRRPRPTLYSLRHTWKTRMAVEQVPLQYQNQMLGHAAVGMDDHYLGDLGIENAYPVISKIEYPELDLSHLIFD